MIRTWRSLHIAKLGGQDSICPVVCSEGQVSGTVRAHSSKWADKDFPRTLGLISMCPERLGSGASGTG